VACERWRETGEVEKGKGKGWIALSILWWAFDAWKGGSAWRGDVREEGYEAVVSVVMMVLLPSQSRSAATRIRLASRRLRIAADFDSTGTVVRGKWSPSSLGDGAHTSP